MPPVLQELPELAQIAIVFVPAISAIFAAAALILNIAQSRKTNAQARSALVAECLKYFASDEDIQRAFYAVDYREFTYDSAFHKSKQEQEIDKLLRHFANLALSWKNGLLSIKDLEPVKYYVLCVMGNPEIAKYVKFVEDWSKSPVNGKHPYSALSELATKLAK